MVIVWVFMMAVVFGEGKKDFDACKKEQFKPAVCKKWEKYNKK